MRRLTDRDVHHMYERLQRYPRATRCLTREDALQLLDEVICRRMEERLPADRLQSWIAGSVTSRPQPAPGRWICLKDHLDHVVTTLGGLYLYPFSAAWDALLCRLLDTCMITGSDTYTLTFALNGQMVTVWRAGRWYAYGTLFAVNGIPLSDRQKWRPRFATLRRLHAVAVHHDVTRRTDSPAQVSVPGQMMPDTER
ncbi:TPA: hypothetical protein O7139_003260 [Salmonella enterica]|nr:hypothetical protein [Salmonella enterica]